MSKRRVVRPYIEDANNIEFTRQVERLSGFGQTQARVAEILGISPGQLSRIRTGERHASLKHIQALRDFGRRLAKERRQQEEASVVTRFIGSPFAIDHAVLARLSPKGAVEAFRNVLWARAAQRGVATTRIAVSSDVNTPDGGVDAAILEGEGASIPEDNLLTGGTRFQIKTGDFRPWQAGSIKKELFGKKSPSFTNLGSEIQRTLAQGKRFVLVCFGTDPTADERQKACENLRRAFEKCGYDGVQIDVWGQSELIGLFLPYPSLCLRLLGHDHQGYRSWFSWQSDDDMQATAHYSPEQLQTIQDLRKTLRSGDITHLRLIGEPGVGKTRFALEIARGHELEPVTLYIRDSRSLMQSSFINELLEIDDHRFVVLIVDECPPKDRAEIWNLLKSRADRVRVITIDHGPDEAVDQKMRIHKVEPVEVEEIVAILVDHQLSESDARRWATFCQGCPRVAHVLGENLRMNRRDLLQSPAVVDVWDRFVVGHDDPNSEAVQLRWTVLRYVSLFERFGFESPVEDEAKFIAKLAEIEWPRFQSIVSDLRQRRIVQGTRTLYVTPRLLHVHLYRDFWKIHGTSFDVIEAFQAMPRSLWHWFVQMLPYTHESPPAEQAIDKLLGPNGLLPGNRFPNDEFTGRIIDALAESSPRATLRCLQRTIRSMEVAGLRALTEPRQSIVWALEKIAVWEDCFAQAAELLLDLAEAENSNNTNSATGTFMQLFSLIPRMAPTQADPALRLTTLTAALESTSSARRRLGLAACETSLRTQHGFRTVGPEYQGLRQTIEFWMPQTYEELWEAHRSVWVLLTDKLKSWSGEERACLISTLIKAAWSALHVKRLTALVVTTLRAVAHDPATNVRALIGFIRRQLKEKRSKLPDDVRTELKSILDSLDGHDFASTLRRFVMHATTDDAFDDDLNPTQIVEQKLDQLADEAVRNNDLLEPELSWVVREDSGPAFAFGFRLAERDGTRKLLPDILKHQRAQTQNAATSFVSGYMAAIFKHDPVEWEAVITRLADDPATADQFSDLVIASGMSDKLAMKVVQQCRSGCQSAGRLERWRFSGRLRQLSLTVVEELVRLQLEGNSGKLWSNAVDMCYTIGFERGKAQPIPERLVFDVLTHDAMADGRAAHSAGYYWSKLAAGFLGQHPTRTWEFFRRVLECSQREWSLLLDLNTSEEHLLTKLVQRDPERAFDCIAEVYRNSHNHDTFGLQCWLSEDGHQLIGSERSGPIQYIPSMKLFDWVDENVDEHGAWLARVMPKTFDKSLGGRLTRNFIARYGENGRIVSALYANFHTRGWVGNDSDHYRHLREQARAWLVDEKDTNVIRWVENYIDELNTDIDRAELVEERQG